MSRPPRAAGPAFRPPRPAADVPPGRPPRHRGKGEETYHGARACQALFVRRPGDMIRVYVATEQRRQWAALLEHCAKARLGFRVLPGDNLARISGSTHHEGIAILARSYRRWGAEELEAAVAAGGIAGPLLYLDGVGNPHNFGAILRTAAHFGCGAVLGRRGDLPPLSPAAVRVAEGAAEHVPVCDLDDPVASLARLKAAGFAIVTTSSRSGEPLFGRGLAGPVVVVLGSEGEGVSRPIVAAADRCVRIPGSGAVESLNVSVACAVLLAEAWRGRPDAAETPAGRRSGGPTHGRPPASRRRRGR
jgi:RNA methyltransferase, TrmH family